ncbi:hypothetical protein KXW63_002415 [Aspergillus fumigatus]|nr:hypothetical protein KXW63_002415 [Aspergillus fumigatus]KAH3494619.1 hypothetical protein KXW24_002859 [Aspergillus fumigatus]
MQLTNNSFSATVASGTTFTARKVILGSGLKDDLPNVPGLHDAFTRVFSGACGVMASSTVTSQLASSVTYRMPTIASKNYPTLNKDIRVYSNGTNNTAQLTRIASKDQNWEGVFKVYNITIINKPILNITRVQNGNIVQDEAIRKEFDNFQVYFTDGTFEEWGAFITNYATSQASELPRQLGVNF